jgi:branched-chain amino acid transport system permease protein
MESIIPQLVVNSIIAGSIYALVALGFNLIFGTTRFFNLAHGVVAAIGGYGTFAMIKVFSQNLYIAIVFGIIVAAFVGWLTEKIVYKPMRKTKSSSTVMLVASLGVFTALQAVIAIIFTSQFQTLSTNIGATKVYEVFGGIITQTQVVILITAILIMVGLGLMMKFTKLGKAIKAISDDEEVAKIVGINTNKVIAKVFIIGSAIAGVAGIAIGFDTGIEPTMGMNLLLKGVIAVIIGGVGNVYGGVAGAFLLGFVENFGIWKISGEWKDAIAFVVLLLFLIFRPEGMFKNKK